MTSLFFLPRHLMTLLLGLLSAILIAESAWARGLCVEDDKQREVCMAQPAQRIAALSPGATELIYAAGAGEKVVAVVSFSDYPPEAKQVTSVGSHTRLDLERVVSLKPDLVLAWGTGNPSEQIATLERIGLTVYYVEPHDFEDIADNIKDMAILSGTEGAGFKAADDFLAGIQALADRYQSAAPVATFYQVWDEPLMSMNSRHYISKVVTLCGGVNVFADSPRLIPRLNQESVLIKNPEAILAGGMGERNAKWLEKWRAFPELLATQRDNLFFIPPSLIQRPTPRLLDGARIMCEKLDVARQQRG
ncbi:Vitamin B12-binding protein precursor [Marinomonas aquimarina]|uniref:Vitamin B12-binding protein n=1 Tax=Marinomonas aquimarina TaxID=295068 RepID=A0A1A8T8D7_9GAMM|nr:cobalamin-binding protein [Marinomonas aquimarina]SBS27550.1 Vitamin B12-binding protein precursor [Marinomonas aquimarina]